MHTLRYKIIITYYLSGHCHGRIPFKTWHFVRHYGDDYLLNESITKMKGGRNCAPTAEKQRAGLDSNNCAAKGYGAVHNMGERLPLLHIHPATQNTSASNGDLNVTASMASGCDTSLQVTDVDELQSLLDKAQTLLRDYTEETTV